MWQSHSVAGKKSSDTPRLDRAIVILRLLAAAGTVVAAVAGYICWVEPLNPDPRMVVLVAGAAAALLAFVVWLLEEKRKGFLETAKGTVQELLRAERIRVMTITNGAFLPTLAALQDLAAIEVQERRNEISGFRQAVVERACDLVKNENPRAAYFRVQELDAKLRLMSPRPYIAQRARTDEFTTQFQEGDGIEPDVWHLIDAAEQAVMREEVNLLDKAYHSYISAPVRAGGIAFGMLTVNVIEAGGLSSEDRDFILVLARLLAVAESLALSPQQRTAYSQMSAARSTITQQEV